jgi:hypothetical protein
MQQPNYEVEDDLALNFFEALKNMQKQSTVVQSHQQEQQHEQQQHQQDHENACLITNVPLNLFHVALECGHKFNYEPLYQEVLRQKGRLGIHNYHEKIGIYQVKCPYCRTLTNRLLPCVGQHPVIKRLVGVNAPAAMCMPGIECSHHIKCEVNAFYEHESKPYCLRHYKIALKTKPKPASTKPKSKSKSKSKSESESDPAKCAAEIQTGKNKGRRCNLNVPTESNSQPPLCKKHSKCNVVLYQTD